MIEPIKHRLPNSEDTNEWGGLEVWDGEYWVRCYRGDVKTGQWWRVIDQTPPPEPEKPKRRKVYFDSEGHCSGNQRRMHAIEVLPGDPPDLDALLEAIDSQDEGDYVDFFDRVIEARHGKGGEG